MVRSWCCSSLQTGAKIIATISLICSVALIAEEFFLIATYGCQGLRSITNQNPEFGDANLIDTQHPHVIVHSNKTVNATQSTNKFGEFKPKICEMQTAELVLSAVWILSWFGDIALAITLIIGARRRSITMCLFWFYVRSAVLVFRVIFIAIYLIAGMSVVSKLPVILLCCFRLYSLWVVGDFINEMREEKLAKAAQATRKPSTTSQDDNDLKLGEKPKL